MTVTANAPAPTTIASWADIDATTARVADANTAIGLITSLIAEFNLPYTGYTAEEVACSTLLDEYRVGEHSDRVEDHVGGIIDAVMDEDWCIEVRDVMWNAAELATMRRLSAMVDPLLTATEVMVEYRAATSEGAQIAVRVPAMPYDDAIAAGAAAIGKPLTSVAPTLVTNATIQRFAVSADGGASWLVNNCHDTADIVASR